MNQKEQLLNKLYSYIYKTKNVPIKTRLKNTLYILDCFNNPHKKLNFFHITGTKGKGTTAHYLHLGLQKNQFKTGLFTSPHLLEEVERIKINENISWSDFNFYLTNIFNIIDQKDKKINFFDILTICAFMYFYDQKVDYAVIEVGIGALYDPTNIIKPMASIITQIDIDHQELLGHTIEEITFKKSFIIKPNTPVYIQSQSNTVLDILKNKSKQNNSPIFIENTDIYFKKKYPTLPSFQHKSLSLVNSILNHLHLKNFKELNLSYASFRILGRFQRINNVLIDVAHNPLSIQELINNYHDLIEKPLQKTVFIIYTKPNKDIQSILDLIPSHWESYFLNLKSPYIKNSHPFFKLKNTIPTIDNFDIINKNTSKNKQFIITGSFLIVEKFLKTYKNENHM